MIELSQRTLTLPERAAGRAEAQQFVGGLPGSLAGSTVLVDASGMAASAPSFLDELVRQILVDRQAARLILENVADRPAQFAEASAERRGVHHRLTTTCRPVAGLFRWR